MRRILVIQDVGLWIDLNRHLSGVDCVELVEAMSFEQGQILAQIERPRIVVYGADNSDGPGRAPEQLLGQLRERGLQDTQVIAVVSGQDGTHGRDPRPHSSDSSDAPAADTRRIELSVSARRFRFRGCCELAKNFLGLRFVATPGIDFRQ